MTTTVVPYLWYPLVLITSVFAFSQLLAHDVFVLLALYATIVCAALGVVALEVITPERQTWRPSWADLATDATFMALVQFAVPRVLTPAATLWAASLTQATSTNMWPHHWPHLAQTLLMVLVVDFLRYWLHRACHRYDWLWRLHQVHHSPNLLYTLNTGRFHPLEKVLHFALDTVPFLLLGVAPEVLAGYFLLYAVNGFFQHSNARLRHGFINYLMSSAELHRWHHARDPKTAMCNFSNTTIVWDIVFGTWSLPRHIEVDVGIIERDYPKGFWRQLIAPFQSSPRAGTEHSRRWRSALIRALLTVRYLIERRRLTRIARNPASCQAEVLARILAANCDTRFGRQHGFHAITDVQRFRSQVPVQDYESLRELINTQIATAEATLTVEPPVCFMRTSATTGQAKDVPITATHLKSLRALHRSSIAFQHHLYPQAFNGSIFAIGSPAVEGRLANGKPFGSASGMVLGNTPRFIRNQFVLPHELASVKDARLKYLAMLRLGLADGAVSYLATANPSTVLALLTCFDEHRETLIDDIQRGEFSWYDQLPSAVANAMRKRLHADPERADKLREYASTPRPGRIARIWPHLKLVVVWTGGGAGVALQALRRELASDTAVHELGYLSSEFMGTVTISRDTGAGVPTLSTHFFEFVECERYDRGQPEYLGLDALSHGHDYYILVTTPSGLYRYFINDVVRVDGFFERTPLLRFMHKGKGVTNITGEKLSESQLLEATHEALAAHALAPRFLIGIADANACRYCLYLELEHDQGMRDTQHYASAIAYAVDEGLSRLNVEYRAKRESMRLNPLCVKWLRAGTETALRSAMMERGQREGQFKIVTLADADSFFFDLDAWVESK